MNASRCVVIVGGGISGLAAAHRCREIARQEQRDLDIVLLEASAQLGGCMQTRNAAGFVMEMGPDSLVVEKPSAIDLAKRVGLGDDLRPMLSEYRGAAVVRSGRLLPIPDDVRLFTPLSVGGLLRSTLLSPLGILRAAIEPLIAARHSQEDESLASFVTRRFGREILQRLAQPLIGGIYSGDPQNVSMQATLPHLLGLERRYGSLVQGMRVANRNSSVGPTAHQMMSLRGGMGSLIAALERSLAGSIYRLSVAIRLERITDGWRIDLRDGRVLKADGVIGAIPARAMAPLIEPAEPALAALLAGIRYHSVATVTMVYPKGNIPKLPRATGFVVPHIEGRKILATTFSSQKFLNRAPEGATVLRAFVGGALAPEMLEYGDEAMIAAVRSDFRDLLGIDVAPQTAIVHRHERALPEYSLGHTLRIAEIERRSAELGAFALAGSAYRGVGIADCVSSGEKAADDVLRTLT